VIRRNHKIKYKPNHSPSESKSGGLFALEEENNMPNFRSGDPSRADGREARERIAKQYPAGTRVELQSLCNYEPGMPPGLRGTVMGVDDEPSLLMSWDNHKSLSLFPGEDSFRTLIPEEIAEEQSQSQDEGMELQ
jgi:hypothetical protein